ncbi:MAG: hypothetical protein HZA82_03300 [Thaumarchaeota archaeon]|nr:hypothetical protein [Nitrososphaerota archaeon]
MSNRSIVFEVSTTKYETDRDLVTSVMNDLQTSCGVNDGFLLSNPVEKFGWSFFKISFKNELLAGMQEKFGTQIMNTKGNAFQEKFSDFVTKFFESKNCKIRMRLVDD